MISWNRSSNGSYSNRSAYEAQFIGRIEQPHLATVWRIKVEPKVQFYTWLLLQNRNWTADRLDRRGWPHSPECPLCDQAPETALHLLLTCPYAQELWVAARSLHLRVAEIALGATSIRSWWRKINTGVPKDARHKQVRFAVYIAWNIWKERNRRVFQATNAQVPTILQLVKDEIGLLQEAARE